MKHSLSCISANIPRASIYAASEGRIVTFRMPFATDFPAGKFPSTMDHVPSAFRLSWIPSALPNPKDLVVARNCALASAVFGLVAGVSRECAEAVASQSVEWMSFRVIEIADEINSAGCETVCMLNCCGVAGIAHHVIESAFSGDCRGCQN